MDDDDVSKQTLLDLFSLEFANQSNAGMNATSKMKADFSYNAPAIQWDVIFIA